jgi:hypothetical protein
MPNKRFYIHKFYFGNSSYNKMSTAAIFGPKNELTFYYIFLSF